MTTKIIPASPNWYCSRIVDSNSRGTLVFGARHEVYTYDALQKPAKFTGVFSGHMQKVTALALSEEICEQNLCCSASEDGRVKLWQVDSLEILSETSIHRSRVTAVCWSQGQADLVVTGDDGGTIGVWQFEDNRQSAHRPEKGPIQTMAASPKRASIVAVGYKGGQILLVDVKRGAAVVARLRGHDEEIHALAWCPVPGEAFRPPRESQDITDLETFGVDDSWRKKPAVSADTVTDFGQDGWMLASGSKDRTVRIWSTSKERQLLLMKLPTSGRRGDRSEDGGKGRLWLALCWPRHTPQQLVSASQTGDLLLWDITKTGKERCQPLNSPGRGHSRMVFTVCPVAGESNKLCTVSMDRMIMFWDVRLKCQAASIPSLGGYCYTINVSPFDPGRVALGVGDSMIRLWNLNSPSDICDMTTLWQGIKSKVTALCWHPKKEGVLAYGTDDGRVGIYDTLSKKPPLISTTYHRRTVYVVAWGPTAATEESTGGSSFSVYSCGDGVILEHNPRHLDVEARAISKLIQTVNPQYRNQTKIPTQSEISFSPDLSHVAVGNDDGTVEIYSVPSFTLTATVQVLHKLINCIQWHPHVTMDTPNGSKYKHCLAVGGNESSVCVVDLSKMYDGTEEGEVLHLVECLRKFEGHDSRITEMAWSPHSDGMLASVSYDGTALVWSVGEGTVLACYRGHLGKLLSVQWNGLDSGEVITGGDDFSAHRWRLDEHQIQPGQLELEGSKKDRKRKKKAALAAVAKRTEPVAMATTESVAMVTEEDQEIAALLEAKKQELLQQGASDLDPGREKVKAEENKTTTQTIESDIVTAEPKLQDNSGAMPDSKGDNKPRTLKQDLGSAKEKKRKPKSMFPETGRRDNMRGRSYILDDIVTLAKLVYGSDEGSDLPEELAHLGLFLDRRAVYACLKLEGEYHRNNDNMEYFYQLEIWKGNINAVLRVARQRDELSDWLVAMAPMASYDTWTSVCEDYALQLEADGQYHKAATYFLACHKVYEAIKLFKRHKLFKEAIALAKVRLSPLDPALEELYTLWAQQLTKDGNYEQAAKCHLAMRQVQDAAKLLARRYDQSSLRTAAQISLVANDRQAGVMYTHRLVQQHLARYQWRDAYNAVQTQKELQVFLATSSIHEMLTSELTKMKTLNVDTSLFTAWQTEQKAKTPLPDFILDPGDVDSLSPWQPRLVKGHTFPHHVLRTWYSQFHVSMDTANLEDMYKTLCLLHAGRQSQVDLAQVLIQVSMDLTLCLLSLMMSETPTAMSHLLQAVGSLHETGHVHVMQGLLQLFLPQGPKYILKLQQEVTAMRVMISMDTHSHVDGASKVHTLKRYLSDLKEDTLVNTGSMRCRELDCLRAYYYVAILNFLKESCEDDPAPEIADAATGTAAVNETKQIGERTGDKADNSGKTKQIGDRTGDIAGISDETKKIGDRTGDIVGISDERKTIGDRTGGKADISKAAGDDTKEVGDRTDGRADISDERSCDNAVKNSIVTTSLTTDITGDKNGSVDVCDGSRLVENGSTAEQVIQNGSEKPESDDVENTKSEKASPHNNEQKNTEDTSSIKIEAGVSIKTDDTNGNCDTETVTCEEKSEKKVLSEDSSAQMSVAKKVEIETLEYSTSSPVSEARVSDPTSNINQKGHTPIPSFDTNPSVTKSDTLMPVPRSDTEVSTSKSGSSQGVSPSPSTPELNASRYSVTMSQLYQISQGLLWDLQAKRFAMTETLGYIHKAISQLLLSKNPQPSESVVAIDTTVPASHNLSGQLQQSPNAGDSTDTDSRTIDNIAHVSQTVDAQAAETGQAQLEGAVGFASGSSGEASDLSSQTSALDSRPRCEHHVTECHDGHICHTALTHHFDHIMTAHTPQVTDPSIPNEHSENEFKCSFFEVCSSCELLQKSRKILFEDEPNFSMRPDGAGLRDMTNVTNPAKYINVPDEWYSMPVDLKYFKPYITMATLKDEQEYVMSELKRGPDSTQSPFPNPLESVKPLLDVSLFSPRISAVDRKEYVQKVVTWALNFAVTSQQKHSFVSLLQTHMET